MLPLRIYNVPPVTASPTRQEQTRYTERFLAELEAQHENDHHAVPTSQPPRHRTATSHTQPPQETTANSCAAVERRSGLGAPRTPLPDDAAGPHHAPGSRDERTPNSLSMTPSSRNETPEDGASGPRAAQRLPEDDDEVLTGGAGGGVQKHLALQARRNAAVAVQK